MDSLDAKLNQLKNAWTEFTTGILNSGVVKFFVDLLTNVLNTVNKMTAGFNTLSNGAQGIVKSISKIGVITAVFNLAKSMFEKFKQWLSKYVTGIGTTFGKGMADGFKQGTEGIRQEAESLGNDIKATSSAGKPPATSTPTTDSSQPT
jgi:archaellum component FlaC